MTWSYSNPSASAKDAIRFLIGDTDTTDQQLQDEEITYLIGLYPSPYSAAANACDALANKYSRQVQKSVGRMSIAAGERCKAYRTAAAELRRKRSTEGLSMFIGGRTISGKETFADDSNAVQPSFAIGQDDFPETQTNVYPPYKDRP